MRRGVVLLALCVAGCCTPCLKPTIPPLLRPALPVLLPVVFVPQGDGAFLSRENLEALVRNVADYRRYVEQAEAQIEYYENAVQLLNGGAK